MPQRSFYYDLPLETRKALDRRLIKAGYGKLLENVAWLETKGYKVTKSALGRYSLELKASRQVAEKLAISLNSPVLESGQGEAYDLIMDLGAMRVREKRVLDRLAEIGMI